MFFKKSYIKVEFLPDGRSVLSARISKSTDANSVAHFINGIVSREHLEPILEKILSVSKKNNALSVGEEIAENVLAFQNSFELKPKLISGRNPIIKPTSVAKQLESGASDE